MATAKNLKNQLAKNQKKGIKGNNPYKTIQDLLKRMEPQIKKALPKHMDPERLSRIAFTEVRKNPKLLECSTHSFLGAIMTSAQLGLEPGVLGHAYLIPYYNKKTNSKEVQFQIGYKGLLDLVRRSGEIESISARCVHEKDEFDFEYGLNEKLVHKPNMNGDRGNLTSVYAIAKFKDGGYSMIVMSKSDVEKIRSRSKSPNNGPWVTDYEAMARKTVLKQLCKYLPLSIEVQRGLVADESTKKEISEDMVEESFDETDWTDVTEVQDFEYSEEPNTKTETDEEKDKEKTFPNKALKDKS
ncbi:MAG: recombination protein RecT [Petrotogales bacterium]